MVEMHVRLPVFSALFPTPSGRRTTGYRQFPVCSCQVADAAFVLTPAGFPPGVVLRTANRI